MMLLKIQTIESPCFGLCDRNEITSQAQRRCGIQNQKMKNFIWLRCGACD